MLSLQNVTITLGGNRILNNTSIQFPAEKISVLLGPSGCGKSTLLRVLAGLLTPDSGQESKSSREKNSTSFVFQEPRLLPWLTVRENILLPFTVSGQNSPDPTSVIQDVGLEHAQELYPHQLSGGMKMRVSIARALITKPLLLLMDEPFAALDEVTRFALQDLLVSIQKKSKMTVVFVTHSFSEAVYLADQIFLLAPKEGKVVESREIIFARRDFSLRSSPEYNQEVQFWGLRLRQWMESAK
jgi:NitT/TauT family transport system ATP-binding protein